MGNTERRTATEAWVELLGPGGRVIHTSPAILAPTRDGGWTNDGPVTFGPLTDPDGGPMVHVTQLRIVTDDGEERIVNL